MVFHFVFFIFLLFICLASCQQTISLGSTLSASDRSAQWSSPSSTFSVSFVAASSSSSSYLAAISYSGGVPVWTAGGDSSVVDSRGTLQLLSSGALRLTNGSGATVWDSGTAGRGVTHASFDDSGNLRLVANRTVEVWSSFENPTDTIIPSQNFTADKVLRSGAYSFNLLSQSGNLTLTWNGSGNQIVYWNQPSNTSINANLSSPSLGVQSIGTLSIYDTTIPNGAIIAYSSDYAESSVRFRFVKLDSDGNLRFYSSDSNGNKTERWAAVSDQCQVFGYCGNMGICSYNDTNSPICGCPSQNFEPVDVNDRRQGCRRRVELQNCSNTAAMLTMEHTVFLTFNPELLQQSFYIGISPCRLNCLTGSSCVASTSLSDGSGICLIKGSNFLSGYQNPSVPSTSFLKVCSPVSPNPSPLSGSSGRSGEWSLKPWIVVVVVLATLLGLVALEAGMWLWCCRNSPKFGVLSAQYALLEYASGAPVQFSYKDLERATKGFKEKLGAGGFGAVYKGTLANRTVVAVKQLEGIEQGEKQFRMEVATISSTHHLNLVRLIGFCSEGRHRLLVYEFMQSGSLDNLLFTSAEHSEKMLSWQYRYSIALGTARGITYLHEECRDCIVHCDIKPENILLDENYHAKVSDFGLAKLINPKDHRHRTLTSVRGTRGYLAPEWLANLPITSKSDVYSYGMVLLEIVSGCRNFEVSAGTDRKKFSYWAYDEFEKGNIEAILDKRLAGQVADMEQVSRVIQVSFWCIQEQPSQRPTMGKVVQMLEGITEIKKPPAPRAASEGSFVGTSMYLSSNNASAFSTLAASAPAPSSSSSLQTPGVSSVASGRNTEKQSSSLLESHTRDESHVPTSTHPVQDSPLS